MSNSYTPGVRHIFDYLNVIRREEPAYDDSFDSGDLSRYTEAKFFDFDMGQPGEEMVAKKDVGAVEPAIVSVDLGIKGGELEFLDFDTFDFPIFPANGEALRPDAVPAFPITVAPSAMVPIPPSMSSSSTTSSPIPFSPGTAKAPKRKASQDQSMQPDSLEESSRLAADEDKRRRNTAASARFRVKKKQREQALERTSKEMLDKCTALEQRISQLETENKWLKNLITEKNIAGDAHEELAARYSAAVANGDIKSDTE